jgi:monoamine oxidase
MSNVAILGGGLPDLGAAHPCGPFGRIACAGSDIASAQQGWFEGALASAKRAVTALAETVLST